MRQEREETNESLESGLYCTLDGLDPLTEGSFSFLPSNAMLTRIKCLLYLQQQLQQRREHLNLMWGLGRHRRSERACEGLIEALVGTVLARGEKAQADFLCGPRAASPAQELPLRAVGRAVV